MNPEPSETTLSIHGWVFYDGRCPWCRAGARLFRGTLAERGFHLAPLQRGWVQERLGLAPAEATSQMRLLTGDGRVLGGADAVVHLARRVWWALPLWCLSRLPGGMAILRRVYAVVAAARPCRDGRHSTVCAARARLTKEPNP